MMLRISRQIPGSTTLEQGAPILADIITVGIIYIDNSGAGDANKGGYYYGGCYLYRSGFF